MKRCFERPTALTRPAVRWPGRALGQDVEVVDVFLHSRRDGAAAKRVFKSVIRGHGAEPRKVVTDKLRSYPVAHCESITEQSNRLRRPESGSGAVASDWGRFSSASGS